MKWFFKQWKRKRRYILLFNIILLYFLFIPDLTDCNEIISSCEFSNIINASKHTSGYILSPNYPNNYPSNQNCSYILTGTPNLVIQISFIDFELENSFPSSRQCLNDYLLVVVIDRNGRRHYENRMCGNKLPKPIKTMQYHVEIMFISSKFSNRRGFKIKYEFIPEEKIPQPASYLDEVNKKYLKECGGKTEEGKQELTGSIQSPGYPSNYPSNSTCYWLIRVGAGKRIYIRLTHFEMSLNMAECDRAYLHIIDGYKHEGKPEFGSSRRLTKTKMEVKYCGNELYYADEESKSFLSEGNRVIVKFVSSNTPTSEQYTKYETEGKPIGFKLRWTEVDDLIEEGMEKNCKGFTCSGGEFCIDDGQNVCAQRTRLCINETLVCNGIGNCAEMDFSDEANCYSDQIVIISTSGMIILILLIIIAIIIQRNRKIKEVNRRVETLRRNNENVLSLNPDAMKMSMLLNTASQVPFDDCQRFTTSKDIIHNGNCSRRGKPSIPVRNASIKSQNCKVTNSLIKSNDSIDELSENEIWQRRKDNICLNEGIPEIMVDGTISDECDVIKDIEEYPNCHKRGRPVLV
uniref:CUB domain-containing protein n=1 Tax=Parastrongyloides trichosuri TaxID=131310 RepID=A0A0N4ZMN6_PARTI